MLIGQSTHVASVNCNTSITTGGLEEEEEEGEEGGEEGEREEEEELTR